MIPQSGKELGFNQCGGGSALLQTAPRRGVRKNLLPHLPRQPPQRRRLIPLYRQLHRPLGQLQQPAGLAAQGGRLRHLLPDFPLAFRGNDGDDDLPNLPRAGGSEF